MSTLLVALLSLSLFQRISNLIVRDPRIPDKGDSANVTLPPRRLTQ